MNTIKDNIHSQFQNIKDLAKTEFMKKGLPTKKDEDFKYTQLSPFSINDLFLGKTIHPIIEKEITEHFTQGLTSYKLVFIDGIFDEKFSHYPSEDVIVAPFSKIWESEKLSKVFFSKYNKITKNEDAFVTMNTAMAEEGSFIYIPKNKIEKQAIELLYINTKQEVPTQQFIRNLLFVDDNAEVSIIKKIHSFTEVELVSNSVTEIYIGKNAELKLYKIQNDVKNVSLLDSTFVEQEQDSRAFIHTFSFGGKVTRNTLNFNHKGENINSTLKGISLIGKDQEIGNHTLVEHNFPNCESHELYKGIYTDNAHGIFNGKIIVDRMAQKTNAFQQNNNVLLSDKSYVDTKPQLEIYADDVKCSHSCTVGQLDDEALFYMKSRGIHEKEARALLMFAFTAEVMQSISIPQIKNYVNKIIAEKLEVNLEFEN